MSAPQRFFGAHPARRVVRRMMRVELIRAVVRPGLRLIRHLGLRIILPILDRTSFASRKGHQEHGCEQLLGSGQEGRVSPSRPLPPSPPPSFDGDVSEDSLQGAKKRTGRARTFHKGISLSTDFGAQSSDDAAGRSRGMTRRHDAAVQGHTPSPHAAQLPSLHARSSLHGQGSPMPPIFTHVPRSPSSIEYPTQAYPSAHSR